MPTGPDADACPCGSGLDYPLCCGPLHDGVPAATAEALMRSRYSAFVKRDAGYLLATWHPSRRPPALDLDDPQQWLGLEVRGTAAGGPDDDTGTVEFVARYKDRGRAGRLHESSRFVREDGRWYYLDGLPRETAGQTEKIGRNAPCPCGSGRKYKRCCGR